MSVTIATHDALAAQIARHPLTPKGRELVASIRSASEPARRVRGGGSVTVRYPSPLMRRVMHLESRSFELPVACALDDSPRTREFYEQPCALDIPLRKEGALRASKVPIYPDFFAIQNDETSASGLWMGFISAKPTARMAELAQEDPGRYYQDDHGRWHDRLVEDYVRAAFGLDDRVDTDAEVPATLVRNITYLADYGIGQVEVAPETRDAVQMLVRRRPGLSGVELREGAALTSDAINQLAWDGAIWFPRERELIRDLDRVHFYPSPELGRALLAQPEAKPIETGRLDIAVGASFRWGERTFQIATFHDDIVDCLADGAITSIKRSELERLFLEGQIVPRAEPVNIAAAVVDLSPKAQERFIARSCGIQRSLAAGRALTPGARRWLREYRRSEVVQGHGIWALRPRFDKCGRWGEDGFRIVSEDRDLAVMVLKEQYLTPEQRTLTFAHDVYRRRFTQEIAPSGVARAPMSRRTFTKVLERTWSREEIARARYGYKAANQAKLRGPIAGGRIDDGLPPAGDRAWERVHIDHTLLDLWVVDSVTRKTLGRPWITVAVDAYSGKALAYELSLEDPSKRLPMQLLRKLVRCYHRLPTTVITDNGSDFKSTYFQTFCAAYGIRHEYRRPAYPRDGSPVEGFLGRLASPVHTLVGNAKPAKEPRALDKDLAPDKRAIWTLHALNREFMEPAMATLNAKAHPIRGLSHDEVYAESVAAQGLRPARRIAYDIPFLALSALPRENELEVGRDGIVITMGGRKIAYWCEAFRDNAVQGTSVLVRDEPWDISRRYANVKGRWHLCRSERFRTELENRTESEIEAASKELKARLGQDPDLDQVVTFLLQVQTVEKRLADEQRAARRRQLVHEIGGDDDIPTTSDGDDEDGDSDQETKDAATDTDSASAW